MFSFVRKEVKYQSNWSYLFDSHYKSPWFYRVDCSGVVDRDIDSDSCRLESSMITFVSVLCQPLYDHYCLTHNHPLQSS